MEREGYKNGEPLTQKEDLNLTGAQTPAREDGKTRPSGKKNVDSDQVREYRKKKQDALEGKDSKSSRGSEPASSKGKGQNDSSKGQSDSRSSKGQSDSRSSKGQSDSRSGKGQSDSGKGDSSDKSGKAGGSGQQSQSSLQSGQTTVQFSSGGGGAGSFGSLLTLFTSSASLIRADAGSFLNLQQTTNLTYRVTQEVRNINLQMGLKDGENTFRGASNVQNEKIPETIRINITLEGGVTSQSRSAGNAQDIFSGILKGISANAAEEGGSQGISTPITVFTLSTPFIVLPFNISSFFFSPEILFTFTNSAANKSGSLLLTPETTNAVSRYFSEVGFPTFANYTYTVISPLPSSTPQAIDKGIVITPDGALKVSVASLGVLPDVETQGLILTNSGDIYTNVTSPISVLLNITGEGSTNILPVRLNAGPGELLTQANGGTNIMVGLINPDTNQFSNTVFRSGSNDTIYGNASEITIYGTETHLYINPQGSPSFNVLNAESNADFYAFSSNTIYRHVGTSEETAPLEAAYGNFKEASISLPLPLPISSPVYNLQFGGNVLDVFGTKYGSGDTLNVLFPAGATFSQAHTITMGGNTLAGFGTSFGDLHTLRLYADPALDWSLVGPTNFIFKGNILYVDKNIGSTLYPHLQNLEMTGEFVSPGETYQPVSFEFQDSVIHGNYGNDTFYGDIQNLGDKNNPLLYNGFITGVTVTDAGGHVKITDLNENTITWGNNTYTGGGQDPAKPTEISHDHYNFTLLGQRYSNAPIMQGHATITDFRPSLDRLTFQLTPDVFKYLDSLGDLSSNYNKQVDAAELTAATTFSSLTNGTLISFLGGGSLKLEGVSISSFAGIPDISIEFNLTYIPLAAITLDPAILQVYGKGPGNFAGPYYNELDRFFDNSLFARYTIIGDIPAGVTIDEFGTIKVTTPDPVFTTLTITGTDQEGIEASSTMRFGFLNAPITTGGVGNLDTPNILVGSPTSTLKGNGETFQIPEEIAATPITITGQTKSFGSNLFVATEGGSTAYGNFVTIGFSAMGKDGLTHSHNSAPPGSARIVDNIYTFKANAFDVVGGTVYGTAKDFNITVAGGDNAKVEFSRQFDTASLDASARFSGNELNFGAQTIYGWGTFYGHLDQLKIDISAGAGTIHTIQNRNVTPNGSMDVSGSVQNNTFDFASTSITVTGDASDSTSYLYGHVNELKVIVDPQFPRGATNFTITATADFSGNVFKFGGTELTGGSGSTNFVGDLTFLGDRYSITTSYYNGFLRGVIVSTSPDGKILTITDTNNNSITWGNDTYTGGSGSDTYNFTLVKDTNDYAVMQGFDIIKNFDASLDTITFNLEAVLYAKLERDALVNNTTLAQEFEKHVLVDTDSSGNTFISFTGGGDSSVNGQLYFADTDLGVTTLQDLINSGNLIIQRSGTAYTPPSIVVNAPFDPVFINADYQNAFASFIANSSLLSDLVFEATGLPAGITLLPNGTLRVDVAGPIDGFITVSVEDDLSTVSLPTLHIFALNTTEDVIKSEEILVKGDSDKAQAFYTATAGNTIIGGGDDLIFAASIQAATLAYESNLIYDISIGAHTAIGHVENISFNKDGSLAGTSLSNQTITFNSNLFNVDAGAGGGIYGNNKSLTLSAMGSANADGVMDAYIEKNIFTFNSNKIYGNGLVYGNMESLSLTIDDPTGITAGTEIGKGVISENEFVFNGNTLIGGSSATSLYAGIGALTMANNETPSFTHASASEIKDSTITFKDSTLTAGTGDTHFYADIADLSNTAFVKSAITYSVVDGHIIINDAQNNSITWGNNTFTGNSGIDTYTFTLFATETGDAVSQGNAIIKNFDASQGQDMINLKLAPILFKRIDTDYNRSISANEIKAAFFSQATLSLLAFAAGSIAFENQSVNESNFTAEFAYTPALITLKDILPDSVLEPVIFTGNGGINSNGIYGNILDTYFNNVDIGDAGSTYTVNSAIPQLTLNSSLFDNWGTATVAPDSAPFLHQVKVTANDVHFSENTPELTLMVATFNGARPSDPLTGTFLGSPYESSLLEGKAGGEIMVGNSQADSEGNPTLTTFTYAPTFSESFQSLEYGTTEFGKNMLINTNENNTAYGAFQTISFDILTDGILTDNETSYAQDITGNNYGFGKNAFLVDGDIYGAADRFSLNVKNTMANQDVAVDDYSAKFTWNILDFGSQTIYALGSGNIYGALNVLDINVAGGQNITGSLGTDVSALIDSNTFNFAANQIIILGSEPVNIYTGINLLSIGITQGTASLDVNAEATFTDNQFIFGDSIAIAGIGGANFYLDINDLSETLFWNSQVSVTQIAEHIFISDPYSNTIAWGNNAIYLGAGVDNIHLNLLASNAMSPIMQGRLLVDGFDPTKDIISFNLAPDVYEKIISMGKPLTGDLLDNFLDTNGNSTVSVGTSTSGADTIISFGTSSGASDLGSITLKNLTSIPSLDASGAPILDAQGDPVQTTITSLADLGYSIRLGTTLVGTPDADSFTFTVPSTEDHSLASFREFSQVKYFDATDDVLQITLPMDVYVTLSQYGMLSGLALIAALEAGAATSFGGIQITKTAAQYSSSNNVAFDSILEFIYTDSTGNAITTGAITLHNVDLNTLSDLGNYNLQLGQQGTSATDTFYLVVPDSAANNFASFQNFGYISGFNTSTVADNLQILLSTALYKALSSDGSIIGNINASSLAGNTATGGIQLINDGTDTTLNFITTDPGTNVSTTSGAVTLKGVTLNSLDDLGAQLQLGALQTGTTGNDIFRYIIPENTQNDFGSFTRFDRLIDFGAAGEDYIRLTLSKGLYEAYSSDGTLNGIVTADSLTGVIQITGEGTNTSLDFMTNGTETGSILLYDTDLTSLTGKLQVGYLEQGTSGVDTFYHTVTGTTFSSFQQFNYIDSFDVGTDKLQLILASDLYNALRASPTASVTAANLAGTSATGGVQLTNDGTDTTLNFVTTNTTYGAITLHNVDIENLTSFGGLQIGALYQGSNAPGNPGKDDFDFHVNSDNFNAFNEFSHIIDFENSAGRDSIDLHLSQSLWENLKDAYQGTGHDDNQVTYEDLETGKADIGKVTVTITDAQFSSDNNVAHDSTIQFTSYDGAQIYGSFTLHNVYLQNGLVDLGSNLNIIAPAPVPPA